MRLPLPLAALLLASALPLRAEPAMIKASVDTSVENTRIVLTHSAALAYTVDSSRRRITIAYAEPFQLDPEELAIDGPLLERIQQRGPSLLVIEVGPDYDRFETFELRNPQRLIVDLLPRAGKLGRADSRGAAPAPPPVIVVIDPGHGGVEQGAIGPSGLREKDVTLALARRLRIALQAGTPGASVVLTRDEDRLVGLDERTAIANHNRADLFVSIHLNASPRADASGAETYYLSSAATDDEARILATQENLDHGSTGAAPLPLDLVLWDLAQNQYIAESANLAGAVQRHLDALAGQRNRGVRQAPFRVLMGATMPAILVEVGFISNPQEEERFRSIEQLNRVVEALDGAVREFLLNLARPAAAGEP